MTNPFFGKCNREALCEAVYEMAHGISIGRLNELHALNDDDKVRVVKTNKP